MAEPPLPHLPEDIIIDNILVRVPVKSVGRFRCVSKSWCSLLSTPKFARAHLNFHTNNEPEGSILIVGRPDHAFCTVNLADESSIVSRKLDIPSSLSDVKMMNPVSGSCHGLVLVRMESESDGWSLNLFNPITMETLKIPDFGSSICALGYDSFQDDYKIVCLSVQQPKIGCISTRPVQNLSIYSVKMETWKSLADLPFQYVSSAGCFVNGCIHWSAWNGRWLIVTAFSLIREETRKLPLPKGLCEGHCLSVAVLGGCLALVARYRGSFDFWVMKEYGVQDSWTKYSVSFPANLSCGVYVGNLCKSGVWEEDEIVFIEGGKKGLVAYNWRNGVWRDIVNSDIPLNRIQSITNFRESLISPKYV